MQKRQVDGTTIVDDELLEWLIDEFANLDEHTISHYIVESLLFVLYNELGYPQYKSEVGEKLASYGSAGFRSTHLRTIIVSSGFDNGMYVCFLL